MTDQLDLFDQPLPTGPMVRRGDRTTSIAVANKKKADPASLTNDQYRVLGNLYRAEDQGLTDFQHGFKQTSAGKRRLELERAGLCERRPGQTRDNNEGSMVEVSFILPDGIRAYRRAAEARRLAGAA